MTRAKPGSKPGSKAGKAPLKKPAGAKAGKTSTRARAKAPAPKLAEKTAAPAPASKPAKKPAEPPAPQLPGLEEAPPVPYEQRVHPDSELALEIVIQSAIGTPQKEIAAVLGISTKTLHEHYKNELKDGLTRANAMVGGVVFKQAVRGVEWAAKLWTAKRMDWPDAPKKIEARISRIELVAPDVPMPIDDDEALLAEDLGADDDDDENEE
jgi:hypothetical protein